MSETPRPIEIPGMQVLREIGRGAHSVVYRALRGDKTFAVKIASGLQAELSSDARRRFRREGAVLARLDSPHLVKVFAAGDNGGSPYIVMELLEGRKMSQLLDSGALDEPLVVSIGKGIAEGLIAVHARGLIHRDLKPSNIVLDPDDRARLIDFGFVLRTGETEAPAEGAFAGTLRYCAPEQAGGSSHPVDARSDLYALGTVLFEAATGTVPFTATDAAELILQHAALPAPKARTLNPKVSPALEAILAKLLEKDPADRYQSASGLAADLGRIGALGERLLAGDPIVLDEKRDRPATRALPPTLFGRADELSKIAQLWKHAVRGEGSVLLVLGDAGMGKSRLLEAARGACAVGSLVLRGDCAEGDAPYAPLRAALDRCVTQLLDAPRADALRSHVLATCKRYAPFLAPISERIAALHPDIQVPAEQDQDQLRTALADFLLELCEGPAPVLVCLDDIQRLDEASQDVLRRLAIGLSGARCLVIAAGRTEEGQVSGLFKQDVAPALGLELVLAGLGEEATGQLASSLLGGLPVDPAFARRFATRTGGNPRVIAEYLDAAFEAGMLLPSWGRWVADEEGLDAVQLPTDVSELALQRVAKLSSATRAVLRMAAVFGLKFDAAEVSRALGEPLEHVLSALTSAVQMQLVERRAGKELQFVHAEVVTAMLAGVDPGELSALHQAVAESLDGSAPTLKGRDASMLARHYWQGDRAKHPRRVFEVCLAAGRRALADFTQEAFDLLKQAEQVASEAGLGTSEELLQALGEVCLRRNEIDEAVRYLREAIAATLSREKRAQLHERLARVFVSKYGAAKARPELEAAFQDLEWSPPSVGAGSQASLHATGRRPEGAELERLRRIADTYDCMTIAVAMGGDTVLARESGEQGLAVAQQIGKSPQLARACMSYAFVSGFSQQREAVEEYGRQAVEIAEELGDPRLVAKCSTYYGTAQAFAGAEPECEQRLVRCYEQHGRWLDADGFNLTCGVLASGFMVRGYARETIDWLDRLVARLKQSDRASTGDHYLLAYGTAALGLLGRFSEGAAWLDRSRGASDPEDLYTLANILSCELVLHVESGELGSPVEDTIRKRRALALPPPEKAFHYLRFFYVFQAYARIGQISRSSIRTPEAANLLEALDELRRAAHIPILQCHLLVIEGAFAWLNERYTEALEWLGRADTLARTTDHPWALFESHRYRARVERDLGNRRASLRDAHLAHALAAEQGWVTRARALRSEFEFESLSSDSSRITPPPTTATTPDARAKLHARYINVQSELARATAKIFDAQEMARTCMDRLANLLAAERAYLFLCPEGTDDLVLAAGRDASGQDLAEPRGYSTTVIQDVRSQRRPVIVSGTAEGELLGSRSVVANKLLSIIAAPIILLERLVGVTYLDSRVAKGIFTREDLEILDGIGQHIAIAIESTRAARIEIERAALEKDLAALRRQTEIPGIQLQREIGRGAHSVVYRALRDGQAFAVKIASGLPAEISADARHRFRHEAAALARFDSPHLVKVFAVGDNGGVPYIVMELLEGRKMSQLLDSGALDEPLVLSIGKSIAAGLIAVHARGLIHRDLKPSNIVLDPDDRARLIDFGFVLRTGETEAPAEGAFAGTLRYCAPEQAGGSSHPVDARSDLYALGTVLFEAATGTVPFTATDAAELIHQHATLPAPKARTLNPKVSPALEAILAKLLEKDPADRYRSASGLAADLGRIGVLDERLLSGGTIVLDDEPAISAPPRPLFGRAEELSKVDNQWKLAVRGTGSVLLVVGEAGMGKSRLVEAARATCGVGALVLRADCAEGDAPYAPLRAAIDRCVTQILDAPLGDALRSHVLATCERYAPFLAPISERIAALHPGVQVLADQDQLRTAGADFLLELCGGPAPVLVCLDDIHFLDEGSQHVLRRLAIGLPEARCLVIAAGRTEAGPTLELFKQDVALALGSELVLEGLGEDTTGQLASWLLGGVPLDPSFARHVATRTGGNPLMIAEYINAALEAGMLFPSWGRWMVDEEGLDAVQLPTNVSGLAFQRVAKLPPAIRDVLRMAAVFGSKFDAAEVARALGEPLEHVQSTLNSAIRVQIVERRTDTELQFVHAGVAAAMLADVDPATLSALHQAVAESLDGSAATLEGRNTYALARHYWQGDRTKHPRRVFEVSLAAGKRALADAVQEAFDFLKQAEQVASEARLGISEELLQALGEACLRRNQVDQAVLYFRNAIVATASRVKRAQLHERLARVFLSKYGAAKARPELEAAFRQLERSYPSLREGSRPGPRATSGRPAGEELERLQTIVNTHDCVTLMEVMAGNAELARESAEQALPVAQEIGRSPQLVRAYMNYAFVSGISQQRPLVDEYGRKAVEVAEELGDRRLIARSTTYCGFAAAYAGAEPECERLLVRCYEQHGRWLDADGFNTVCGTLSSGFMVRGYARETIDWLERLIVRLKQSDRARTGDHYLLAYGAAALGLLGRFSEGAAWLKRSRGASDPEDLYTLANILSCELVLHLENGELGPPLEKTIRRRRALALPPPEKAFHYLRFFYVFQAYARVAQSSRSSVRTPDAADLLEALDELRRAAHIPILQCHLLVIEGAFAWLNERYTEALEWLSRADALARTTDHPWALFESHRYRARIERDLGNRRASLREAHIAHALAAEQGWVARARALRSEFEFESLSPDSSRSTPSPTAAAAPDARAKLHARYINVQSELARSTAKIFDAREMARTCMDRLAHLLTAERAYLFLCPEGTDDLVLAAGRDAGGQDLTEPRGYSTTVIQDVQTQRRPVIVSGTAEGEILGSRSVVANKLLSIIAAPIILLERLVGVTYLDSRVAKGIFTREDLEILDGIGQHIAIALESTRAARIEIERAALEKDLAVTAAVQALILPKESSVHTERWDLASFHRPATISGGDWWWYEAQADGGVIVLVGDVTGHGAGSAMVTAIVAGCYEAVRMHATDQSLPFRLTAIDSMLTKLSAGQYWMTMGGLHLEPTTGTLSWWNAAGTPMVYMRADGSIDILHAAGAPLGMGIPSFGYKTATLQGGERLLMITDGIIEMTTQSKRVLGMRGLIKMLEATRGEPIEAARAQLVQALDRARGDVVQDDDITFVLIDLPLPPG